MAKNMTKKDKISWIYFLRHGESESNAESDFLGHPREIGLTSKGIAQAKDVFGILKKEKFDLIVTSTFERSKQMAAPFINRFGQKVPIKTWPVEEFTYHALEKYLNMKQSVRFKNAGKYWLKSDPDYRDGQGAETYREFIKRIDLVRNRLVKGKFQKILIISHGHFIRHFIWRLLHADWEINHQSMDLAGKFGWGMDTKNTALIKIAKIGNELYVGKITEKHLKKV